jgi:hypothetical protein
MRRNPLALLCALGAVYIYLIIRQAGRLLGAVLLGVPAKSVVLYKVLPAFDVAPSAAEIAPSGLAALILMAPLLALVVGYVLLIAVRRASERLPYGLRLLVCLVSYLCLIIDPAYYGVVPLLRLGGEPEFVARVLGDSQVIIALPAIVILGLNVILARRILVPAIKGSREGDR